MLVPTVRRGPLGVPIILPPHPEQQLIAGTGVDVIEKKKREVFDSVTKLVDRLTEVEVKFSYRVTLRSLELTMKGNTVTCEANLGFSLDGKVLRAGVVPVGPTTTADGKMTLRVSKIISWSEKGKLVFTDGETKVSIDPLSGLTAFPKIDPGTILATNLVLDLVGRVLNDEVGKAATFLLPGLPDVANKLAEAHKIEGIGTLVLNPQECQLFPLTGDEKTIRTTVALRCRPVLRPERPHETLAGTYTPAIKYAPKAGPPPGLGFHLELECLLDATWIGDKLTDQMNGIVPLKWRTRLVPAGDGVVLIQSPVDAAQVKKYIDSIPWGNLVARMVSIPDSVSVWGDFRFTERSVLLRDAESQPSFLMTAINMFALTLPKDGQPAKPDRIAKERTLFFFNLPGNEILSLKQDVGIGEVSLSVAKSRIAELYLTPEQLKIVLVIDGKMELSVPTSSLAK